MAVLIIYSYILELFGKIYKQYLSPYYQLTIDDEESRL